MLRSHPLELKLKKEGILDVAGIDEAGRGPWAGPIVAAAVIFPNKIQLKGLNDSKKLSEIQRFKLFNAILKRAIVSIGIVDNYHIDNNGLTKSLNLAYVKALKGLSRQPKYVLIDGIGTYDINLPYKTIIKGDSKVRLIAAASIVAKVVRDTLMVQYSLKYPSYGFEKHKGYGTRQHHQNLIKYGVCNLHRLSFEPVKKIMNESK